MIPPSPPVQTPTNAALLAVERLRLLMDRAAERDAGAPSEPEALEALETRLQGREGATRSRLQQLFGLTPAELDALDCCVAVAVEPALGPRIAELQGMPGCFLPTAVALRLIFGHGPEPLPRSGSALLGWNLLTRRPTHAGAPAMLEADPAIVEWYFGLPSLAGAEGLALTWDPPAEPLEEWGVEGLAARIRAAMVAGMPVRVAVGGLPGSGRAGLAMALAAALGQRGLLVTRPSSEPPPPEAVLRLQRLAWLVPDLVPVWREDPGTWPVAERLAPLQFVTVEGEPQLPRRAGVTDLAMAVPPLAPASLHRLARATLPAALAAALSPLGAPRLADLADAAALGLDDPGEFQELLRQRTRERVRGVGQIVTPRFGWDDLVLPAPVKDLLRAMEAEARARDALLSPPETRRLFESTASLTALFAGPPGTGKSMAGQVLAGALSLDLLVIDTSAISSKFIGETAKNLSNAFAVAREANCAIMFEEADGLFARRVETDSVNARHANADTGHLLQLVEAHRHLVMLSTNRRGNIDPAFLRRLRFIVDFPLPEAGERRDLWGRMLTVLGVPEGQVAALATPVAEAHPLSAAQIKAAALSAAFEARSAGRPIAPTDLLAGIHRELAKEGRVGDFLTPAMMVGRRGRG